MPSRLLREGILDSEAVNALSFAAEVFYRRLMSVVDDFGRPRAAVRRGRQTIPPVPQTRHAPRKAIEVPHPADRYNPA
jgi:hypothetical protein